MLFFFNKKKTTLQAMLVGENADKNTKQLEQEQKTTKEEVKSLLDQIKWEQAFPEGTTHLYME